MDSTAIGLEKLLTYAADDLDVPPEVDAQLTARYRQLASWIKEHHSTRFRADSEIYPQGSRRLGVMVQPVNPEDDHDVDLVFRRDILRESITQAELKETLGSLLSEFVDHLRELGDDPPRLTEGSRCWTLTWRGFHMDVLPALPHDLLAKARDPRIIITDKDLHEWQTSNPQGYAVWFQARMQRSHTSLRAEMAKSAAVKIHDIPPERVKTPLQRLVQLLKRHRDLRFDGDRDGKPASIIITTLAARSYKDGADLPEALHAFRSGARGLIEVRAGVEWVANPVNDEENFADRWVKYPDRREHFFEWLQQVEDEFGAMSHQDGVHRLTEKLAKSFGDALAARVVRRAGNEVLQLRNQGRLSVTSGNGTLSTAGSIAVPAHTFFGSDA